MNIYHVFPSESHIDQAIHKNLNLFEASCSKQFFGGNFQLRNHFWTLPAVTLYQAYNIHVNCTFHGKALNVEYEIKKKILANM